MKKDKSRVVAILLALFLGGFGIQRFYIGQAGWGVLLAFTFWTGVPAVVAIIDIVRWLLIDDKEFNSRYSIT